MVINDMELSELLTTYNLCQEFHKLPSELYREDAQTINKFLIILDEKAKIEKSERKKLERKAKRIRRR